MVKGDTMSNEPLRVGDVLYGFCAGYFGRDSYEDKRVEAIGADWVVVRYVDEFVEGVDFAAVAPAQLTEFREKEGRHDE